MGGNDSIDLIVETIDSPFFGEDIETWKINGRGFDGFARTWLNFWRKQCTS